MATPSLARGAKAAPAVVLALLLAWAAHERFRLPLTPCADGDIRAYLGPALSQFRGAGFVHLYGQCFLYPGFVWAILRLGGDFRWLTAVQNAGGLATGAALFACWRELRRLFPAARVPAAAHDLAGVALAAVYLFSSATIGFERAIRPEAIFPLFAILNIYCNLRFITARSTQAVVWGTFAIFLSVAAWLIKPSFSVMLLLANLPIFISLFRAGQTVRQKIATIGIPLVAAGVLLILPEAILRGADPMKDSYVALSLFSVHADIIDDQLAEDARTNAAVPFPIMFVSAAHEQLSAALAEDRAHHSKFWPALGFNPDYLILEPDAFAKWLDQVLVPSREIEFYRYYYWRSMRLRPGQLAKKVGRQFRVFYHFGGCPAYAPKFRPVLAADYRNSAQSLQAMPDLRKIPAGQAFVARTDALSSSAMQIGPFPRAEKFGRFLAATYLAGLLVTALLTFFPVMRPAAIATLFLYSYNFGTVLALAIAHTLDVGRYSQYQLSYTLLAQFASFWLVAETLARVRKPD